MSAEGTHSECGGYTQCVRRVHTVSAEGTHSECRGYTQ